MVCPLCASHQTYAECFIGQMSARVKAFRCRYCGWTWTRTR